MKKTPWLFPAAMLGLVMLRPGAAWAGYLEDKWSGSIRFVDETLPPISGLESNQGAGKGDDPPSESQKLHYFRWDASGQRVISVQICDGAYTTSMDGSGLNLSAIYEFNEAIFQPTISSRDCGWALELLEPMCIAPPEGKLTVDVGCDGPYKITLEGAHNSSDYRYELADTSRTPEHCGYVSLERSPSRTWTEDTQTIEGTTTDHDRFEGRTTTCSWGTPAWYSAVVGDMVRTLCSQTPPNQSATIAAVAGADANNVGHFTSTTWRLQRSPRHWAGSFTMTRTVSSVTNGTWTPDPYPGGDGQYANLVDTYSQVRHLLDTVQVTVPRNGGPGQAKGTYLSVVSITNAEEGEVDCNYGKPGLPPAWGHFRWERTQTTTRQGGGSGSTASLEATPVGGVQQLVFNCDFDLPMTGTITRTSTYTFANPCGQPANETSSNVLPDEDSEVGIAFTANLSSDCQHAKGQDLVYHSSMDDHPNWGKVTNDLLVTYDLTLADSVKQSPLAVGRAPLGRSPRPLDLLPTAQPLPLSGGTIECQFTDAFSSTNIVPEGWAQAGATLQTDAAYQYAATITNAGGSFRALVQACQASTNRADTLQIATCTQSDGTIETTVTNSVPTTIHRTLSAGLTNDVAATVCATLEGDQYRVHVEIPPARNGHCDLVWRLTRQATCADLPPVEERRLATDSWAAGPRILDFFGTLDPANPRALSGQMQFDQGWIKWNLKTSVSPALRLRVSLAPDGQKLLVAWDSAPNIRLQSSASLSAAVWEEVPGSLGASNISLSMTNTARFFRLTQPAAASATP